MYRRSAVATGSPTQALEEVLRRRLARPERALEAVSALAPVREATTLGCSCTRAIGGERRRVADVLVRVVRLDAETLSLIATVDADDEQTRAELFDSGEHAPIERDEICDLLGTDTPMTRAVGALVGQER